MTDQDLAKKIRTAAETLASAMNEAGRSGLHIKLEMRPHNREDFGNGRCKVYGYLPILSVTRTIAA